MKTKILLIGILILAAAHAAAAQSVSISSSISPRSGTLSDTFIFSVTVKGVSGKRPTLSGGPDWSTSYIGPNSQVTIINGSISALVTYSYALTPRKEGTLGTPEANLEVEGQKFTAPAIAVKIGPSARTGSSAAASPAGITLRQSLSQPAVYQGEQVVHKLELVSTASLINPTLADLPFDGFWQEPIGSLESDRRSVRGEPQVTLTWRKALYALRSGDITIPQRSLTVQVRERKSLTKPFGLPDFFGQDNFDEFFGLYSYRTQTLRSNELTLKVKPLPPTPAGHQDWGIASPLVGETQISVTYDPSALKVGESKSVVVEITSLGNLNPFRKAPLDESRSYHLYGEAPQIRNFENNGQLISKRILKYSIVPLVPGAVRIPPLELGYFNPAEAAYLTARSQEVAFNAIGAALISESRAPTPTPAALGTPLPSAPPAPLVYREESLLERVSNSLSASLLLLLLITVLILAAFVYALVLGARARLRADTGRRTVQEAATADELRRALLAFAAPRLGRDPQLCALDDLRHAVSSAEISPQARFLLADILDRFDRVLYAPTGEERGEVESLKDKILELFRVW